MLFLVGNTSDPSNTRARSVSEVRERFLVSFSDLFVENNSIAWEDVKRTTFQPRYQGEQSSWKRGWRLKCELKEAIKCYIKKGMVCGQNWLKHQVWDTLGRIVVVVGLNEITRTSAVFNFKNDKKQIDEYYKRYE